MTLFEVDGLVPLPCVCFCGSFMVLFYLFFLIYIVISHSCGVKFESVMCVKPAQSMFNRVCREAGRRPLSCASQRKVSFSIGDFTCADRIVQHHPGMSTIFALHPGKMCLFGQQKGSAALFLCV